MNDEASDYAKRNGLETVFHKLHEFRNRIFYDPKNGSYYDRNSDVYISVNEFLAIAEACRKAW